MLANLGSVLRVVSAGSCLLAGPTANIAESRTCAWFVVPSIRKNSDHTSIYPCIICEDKAIIFHAADTCESYADVCGSQAGGMQAWNERWEQ
eukprot:scaffold22661_cov17-Prasinocladus_malaysianus.AAC.1